MGCRRRAPLLFSTAVSVGVLAAAGCGGAAQHEAATSSTSTSPSAAAPPDPDRAGPESLPEGFPPDVPVVKGAIDGKHVDIPGSGGKVWTLSVTGIDAGAFDTAAGLLSKTGFVPGDPGQHWSRHTCEQQGQFSKDAPDGGGYVVAICGFPAEPTYTLEYTVNIYPRSDWQAPPAPPIPLPIPEPPR